MSENFLCVVQDTEPQIQEVNPKKDKLKCTQDASQTSENKQTNKKIKNLQSNEIEMAT